MPIWVCNSGARGRSTSARESLSMASSGVTTVNIPSVQSQPNSGATTDLVAQADRLRRNGKPVRAAEVLRRALALEPDNAPALRMLGSIAFEDGNIPAAADFLRRAIAARPDVAGYHLDLVNCLRILQRHDEAVAALRRGFALGADDAFAWHTLGSIMADLGRSAEAERAFRTATEKNPSLGYAWYGLAQVNAFSVGDAEFATVQRLLEREDLPQADRMHMHFALGRVCEAVADYDRAFEHFHEGNEIMRRLRPFDASAEAENARRIERSFTRDVFAAAAGSGHPSEVPVFVAGMPRSGSSLVEQILDSHPQVHGAGEVNYLWRTVSAIDRYLPPGASLPEAIGEVSPEAWPRLAEAYLERLSVHAPDAERIVDKLPFNYTLLGMVRLMFPRARIIHSLRDPLDTCVSCYTTSFANDRGFTSSLEDLGVTYRAYDALMRHWRAVLPGGLLDVGYESLVEDTEAGARRIVDYLGLNWSETCLEFHRNPRAVGTASNTQVRRPAYRTSIGRWRHFERHLGPLRDGLGDIVAGGGAA
ncbi:MAG: tetratricopeptide repeat-containing sulfotransferase family protein [Gammaproteobacteria bacterium]